MQLGIHRRSKIRNDFPVKYQHYRDRGHPFRYVSTNHHFESKDCTGATVELPRMKSQTTWSWLDSMVHDWTRLNPDLSRMLLSYCSPPSSVLFPRERRRIRLWEDYERASDLAWLLPSTLAGQIKRLPFWRFVAECITEFSKSAIMSACKKYSLYQKRDRTDKDVLVRNESHRKTSALLVRLTLPRVSWRRLSALRLTVQIN